jgi:hypothetical protein
MFKSLKDPEPPDIHDRTDMARYRRECDEWWDNWEHNFALSLKLVLWGTLAVIAMIIIVALI